MSGQENQAGPERRASRGGGSAIEEGQARALRVGGGAVASVGGGMKRAKSSALCLTLQPNLVQDNIPLEITSKLYIGSIHAAFNQDAISERGITHIINASGLPATFPRLFTYLSIELRDKEASNILACVPAANIFIEAGLAEGAVLVHCAGGRSRSAALVTAYLMSSRGWSFDYAVSVVKAARPVIQINKGFEQQLRAYGAQRCDLYAAQQVIVRQRLRALVDRRILLSGEPKGGLGGGERRSSLEPALLSSSSSSAAPPPLQQQEGGGAISPAELRSVGGNNPSSSSFSTSHKAISSTNTATAVARGPSSLSLSVPAPSNDGVAAMDVGDSGVEGDAADSNNNAAGDVNNNNEAYESLFGAADASSQSLKRGGGGGGGGNEGGAKAVNRSLHRRGRTEQGTTLPPISPSTPEPVLSPSTPHGRGVAHAFAETTATTRQPPEAASGGAHPTNQGSGAFPLTSPLGLRSPYSSMSRLSLDQQHHTHLTTTDATTTNTRGSALGGGRLSIPHGNRVTMAMDVATSTAEDPPPSLGPPPTPMARRSLGAPGTSSSHDPSSLLNARNRYSSAPALPQMNIMGVKQSKHELIAQAPPTPHLRLTRPGSAAVQIIPPLQGLERTFLCMACNTRLFAVGNVIYLDFQPLDGAPIVEVEGATIVQEEGEEDDDEEQESKGKGSSSGNSKNGPTTTTTSNNNKPVTSPVEAKASAAPSGAREGGGGGAIMDVGAGGGGRSTTPVTSSDNALSTTNLSLTLGGSRRLSNSSSSGVTSPAAPSPTPLSVSTAARGHGERRPSFRLAPDGGGALSPSLSLTRGGSQLLSTSTTLLMSPLGSTAGGPSLKPKPAPLRELVLTANANGSNRGNTDEGGIESTTLRGDPEGLSIIASSSSPTPGTPLSCCSSTTGGLADSPVPPLSPADALLLSSCDSPLFGNVAVSSPASAMFRPASAEKRRWVAKMKHLECDRGGDMAVKALENDVEACSKLRPYKGVWIPIEYMPWMGDILAEDQGIIHCPNVNCHCEVGRWDWTDTLFKGDLISMVTELPLIGINKNKIVVAPSPSSSRSGSFSRLSNNSSSENTPRDSLTPRDNAGNPMTTSSSTTPRCSANTPSSSGSGGGGCTPVGSSGGGKQAGGYNMSGTSGPATPFSHFGSPVAGIS